MDLTKIHPLVLETWAAHEFFRRLGHSADDIYVEGYPEGVVVRVEALDSGSAWSTPKFFRLKVGELGGLTPEEFQKLWLEFLELWNGRAIPDEVAAKMWEESQVANKGVSIITVMASAGFPIREPVHDEVMNNKSHKRM